MGQDNFGGVLLRPDIDFSQVRDGRRSPLFHYDVDLSTARSVAAGTHLVLPLAGDSFYIDKDPLIVGAATVHFQDTTFGNAPAPVYCERGFIGKVPFTQLLIENIAQPGMIFRIHYGVNIDFLPGASTSTQITGAVSIVDTVASNAQHNFNQYGTPLGNNMNQIIAPAANTNGILLKAVYGRALALATGEVISTLIASPINPVDNLSGPNRIVIGIVDAVGSAAASSVDLFRAYNYSRNIPAGWGVFAYDQGFTVAGGNRSWNIEGSW